jgi:hypothetical protein
MPFQVSPGVNVSEIDLTNVVPAVSVSDGAIAGEFNWGPVEQRVLVSSEAVLAGSFGSPTNVEAVSFFTAASYLGYSNRLHVVRVDAGANNATASGTSVLIKNSDDYDNNFPNGSPASGIVAAKYPGTLGNSIRFGICQSANTWSSSVTTANLVFTAGSTTVLTKGANTSADLTSGPNIDISSVVSAGDILVIKSATINLGVGSKIASVNSTAITLSTAPTQDQLSVENNATLVQTNSAERYWEYYRNFDGAPGTSTSVAAAGGSNDEIHMVVVDEDGDITGIPGTVLETYPNVSQYKNAKSDDGEAIYYKNVLYNSQWLWWTDHPSALSLETVASASFSVSSDLPISYSLTGGLDAAAATNSAKIDAYNLFLNSEEIDLGFILGADADTGLATHLIQSIAEVRKDCIVCLSPEYADAVNNSTYSGKEVVDTVAFRNTLPSSSYAVMDSAWKYIYDKYNDQYRWIPLNGDTAGTMARTDSVRDPWFSPAGYNRGAIKNVIKLSYNPSKEQRDDLYKNGINPIVSFPGEGTVLYGDKTMLSKPSAFDRINVRRLFIVLEKALATAAKYTLFEFNDDFTRSQFKNLVEPFLREVQGRRGIFDYRVVCDETNNTPEVIDRNEFVGDIYIKPARSINFIQLNFVAVRTGISFDEVVGQF